MTALPAAALRTATCCVIMMLAGCATTGERNATDPFESANRKVYAFNDGVDRYTLKPTAKAYEKAVRSWCAPASPISSPTSITRSRS